MQVQSMMQNHALKQKSDIHLIRKIWHRTGVCAMAALFNLVSLKTSWILLIAALAFFLPLDILRQKRPGLNKLTLKLFGPVMRQHEYQAMSGMTYLFLGALFLLVLRDKHIVTLTLLFLAFGDPVASFFGIRYGKDPIMGSKTLQGTLAAFAICTILAAIYYYFNNLMTERLIIVTLLSGLIGALAELIPIGKLDDNFTFPVVSASFLWLLFKIFGG